MNFSTDEDSAILSKSLVFIQKALSTLSQFDRSRFPTRDSEVALDLLRESYKRLCDPAFLQPVSASVLYNRLFFLQELEGLVTRSTTDHISWPLVSYCDELWLRFFKDKKTRIFYSVTSEHNYSILPFSNCLSLGVRDLLAAKAIDSIVKGRKVYCLQLASAENANLPLYANISHEFGHAIYDSRETEIVALLAQAMSSVESQIIAELNALGAPELQDRAELMGGALTSMAQELFCDLIGAMLMGPAFYLSLYEIGWGSTKSISTVVLTPDDDIRAYPSFLYRLDCIRRYARIADFCTSPASLIARSRLAAHSQSSWFPC